jgi:uncharacterized membrane protein
LSELNVKYEQKLRTVEILNYRNYLVSTEFKKYLMQVLAMLTIVVICADLFVIGIFPIDSSSTWFFLLSFHIFLANFVLYGTFILVKDLKKLKQEILKFFVTH